MLFLHTQRGAAADVGVWAAVVAPTPDDFGVRLHAPLWRAAGGAGASTHDEWRQFTFGEPAAILLDNGDLLLTFWYADDHEGGIRLVRVRIEDEACQTRYFAPCFATDITSLRRNRNG